MESCIRQGNQVLSRTRPGGPRIGHVSLAVSAARNLLILDITPVPRITQSLHLLEETRQFSCGTSLQGP